MFQAASEVENLKAQMMTLFKELQQAQSKLDEAEGMKKNLQDRFGPHKHTCTISVLFKTERCRKAPTKLMPQLLFDLWCADVGRWSRTWRL